MNSHNYLHATVEEVVKEKMMIVQENLNKLKVKYEEVIYFHELGFRNPEEANS